MADFNTNQYGWKDLTIAYGGRVIDGIEEVEYSRKQNKEYLYGRGNKPYSILKGNVEYEGKITIWQSELEAMERDSKTGSALDLEFDITIAYEPEDGGETRIDTLKGVQFTEYAKGMAQGDTHKKIEMPIMFRCIK